MFWCTILLAGQVVFNVGFLSIIFSILAKVLFITKTYGSRVNIWLITIFEGAPVVLTIFRWMLRMEQPSGIRLFITTITLIICIIIYFTHEYKYIYVEEEG